MENVNSVVLKDGRTMGELGEGDVIGLPDKRRYMVINKGDIADNVIIMRDWTAPKVWADKDSVGMFMSNPVVANSQWWACYLMNEPYIKKFHENSCRVPDLTGKKVLFVSRGPGLANHLKTGMKFIRRAHNEGMVIFALSHVSAFLKVELPHPHYYCHSDAGAHQETFKVNEKGEYTDCPILREDHSKDYGVFSFHAAHPLVERPYAKRYFYAFGTRHFPSNKILDKYPNLPRVDTAYTVTIPMLHFIYKCNPKEIWMYGFDHMYYDKTKMAEERYGTSQYKELEVRDGGKLVGYTSGDLKTVSSMINAQAHFLGKVGIKMYSISEGYQLTNLPQLTFSEAIKKLRKKEDV